ncbi:hypothetical protein [Burkholderia territorii]|uniref:hypothetical protein n=1 Tax=Burkholderia territorii TaxID=1503055 RepID=UPI00075E1304|nr:hypothetical protein [Burkholderia territorii]KWO62554.1 hypothetical protein WT98_30250 [Burkholderia territorii]
MSRKSIHTALLSSALTATLTLMTTPASAQASSIEEYDRIQKDMQRCNFTWNVYANIVSARDAQASPEEALRFYMRAYDKAIDNGDINEKFMKDAINKVYFDPNLQRRPAEYFIAVAQGACLDGRNFIGPNPKFKPLK